MRYYWLTPAAVAVFLAFALVPSVVLVGTGPVQDGPQPAPDVSLPKRVTARFGPHGGCQDLVAWHMDLAARRLDVASYQWSNRKVHDALKRAKARGVAVRLLIDPDPEHREQAQELIASGWGSNSLRVDDKHPIFHDKYALRDPDDPLKAAHENGSYNYSESAERNAENAQVVEGFPAATAEYAADFEKHWAHSRPATRKAGRP